MRRRFISLLVIVFVVCVLLVQLAPQPIYGSLYASSPEGARALFLLLERQGIRPHVLREPFASLLKDEHDAVLLLLAPRSLEGSDELLAWVRQGNTLVYAASRGALEGILGKEAGVESAEIGLDHALAILEQGAGASVPVRCPRELHGVCTGVERLSMPAWPLQLEGDAEVLAGSKERAYVVYKKAGAGSILLFAGPEPFLNEYIDRYDNLRFVYQLIEGRSRVIFDEFHHGYHAPPAAARQSQWWSLRCFLWGMLALLVLGAFSRAVRFGRPTPIPNVEAPPSAEFTAVLGILYREHGAASVLRHYVRAWRMRVARRWGVQKRLSRDQAIDRLASMGVVGGGEREPLSQALALLGQAEDGAVKEEVQLKAVLTLERVTT